MLLFEEFIENLLDLTSCQQINSVIILYKDLFFKNLCYNDWVYLGDKLLYWLEYSDINKGYENILYHLKKKYIINHDYKIINNNDFVEKNYIVPDIIIPKYKKDNRGGSNKLHIVMTGSCFKSISILLNTKKGKEIQNYYVNMDCLIKLYERYQCEYNIKINN